MVPDSSKEVCNCKKPMQQPLLSWPRLMAVLNRLILGEGPSDAGNDLMTRARMMFYFEFNYDILWRAECDDSQTGHTSLAPQMPQEHRFGIRNLEYEFAGLYCVHQSDASGPAQLKGGCSLSLPSLIEPRAFGICSCDRVWLRFRPRECIAGSEDDEATYYIYL